MTSCSAIMPPYTCVCLILCGTCQNSYIPSYARQMKVVLMACMFLMLSGVLTMRRDTMDSKQIVMTGT